MRKWLSFLKLASLGGWEWLVGVGNHVGLVAVLVGGAGFSAISHVFGNWWLAAFYVLCVTFLTFSAGAFILWRDKGRQTLGIYRDQLARLVARLEQQRDRANSWLGRLRDEPEYAPAVESLVDLQWQPEIERSLREWSPDWLRMFQDETGPLQAPAQDDKAARVFNRLERRVRNLDRVIDIAASMRDGMSESLNKSRWA